MNFDQTNPCPNCPFRTDTLPYLTKARAKEISLAITIQQKTFTCHKYVEHNDEGEAVDNPDGQHCAGALILLEKLDQPNQMMRIAERLRFYDRKKLNMDAPVFNDCASFIKAQKKKG